jgi:ligand-binding SRPBCC domain-containing protein
MALVLLTNLIHAPIEICFDLSRSIDLHKISTAQTNEEAISGVTSGLIGLGEQVSWRAKHFGITQTLTTKITAFNTPTFFQDQMVRGAFKSIIHNHIFETKGNLTLMKDEFYFLAPFGVVGKAVEKLFLVDYMTKLLVQRNKVIKETAESGEWKKILTTNKIYNGN